MQTIVILAADYREGRRFAGDIGLGMGAIVPVDASRLAGLRPSVILELPSYAHRRDRHAMEAVLQRQYVKMGAPVIEMFIEDPLEFRPAPAADASVAKAEPLPGDQVPGQTTVDEQVALAAADRLRGLAAIETTAVATSEVQAVADAPKTPEAQTPPKPGYKPRSRKRS